MRWLDVLDKYFIGEYILQGQMTHLEPMLLHYMSAGYLLST